MFFIKGPFKTMAEHLASVLRPGDLFFYLKTGGGMSQAAELRVSRCCSRLCIKSPDGVVRSGTGGFNRLSIAIFQEHFEVRFFSCMFV